MNGVVTGAEPGVEMSSAALSGAASAVQVGARHDFVIECRGPGGRLKWVEYAENLIPNAGLNEMLDKFYKGSGYTAAFYVGLMDGTPTPAAGDTMASQAGWDELTAYSGSNRPTLVLGSVSGQSVDNSASKASFTIDTNSTVIGGAFLVTDATKGGTAGILISAAAFAAGNKQIDQNDVLNVTVTCTFASS